MSWLQVWTFGLCIVVVAAFDHRQLRRLEGPNSYEDQLLDHFDTSNRRRWSQPYTLRCRDKEPGVSSAYVQLELLGESGPGWEEVEMRHKRSVCLPGSIPLIRLNHRFYEEAQPTGDLTLDSLRFHTSRQALEDAARFIREVIRGQMNMTEPIVVTGGSYPGALAVWFRVKYPHLVVGGIGLSPVIHPQTAYPEFENVSLGVLRKEVPDCLKQLTKVYGEIRSKPKRELFGRLGLCLAGKSTVDDLVDGLWSRLTYKINEELVQYWQSSELDGFCSAFQASPYKALRETFVDALRTGGPEQCVSPTRLHKYRFPTGDWESFACSSPPCYIQRAWWWQKCAEFGWFKVTDAAPHTFYFYSLQEFYDTCQKIYHFTREDVEENVRRTNDYYGGRNISAASNLLIVNGAYDPWHAVSLKPNHPIKSPVPANQAIVSVMVDRRGHCPQNSDVRRISGQLIQRWLSAAESDRARVRRKGLPTP